MRSIFLLLTLFLVVLAGCSDAAKVRELRRENAVLRQQIAGLCGNNAELRLVENAELRRKIAGLLQENAELHRKIAELRRVVAALCSESAEKRRRLGGPPKGPKTFFLWCDPDGEILLADNKLGYCWVDISKRHGLKAGHIFEVFRYVKGGSRKVKGRIEIKKVEDNISKAAIIETLDPEDDPIVKGDHIISPLFDKNEVLEFVFAGELTNPTYSKAQVKKMIEELGGKVASEVSIETDFFVLGKGAEETEEYTRALDLSIIIMSEKELLKYFRK